MIHSVRSGINFEETLTKRQGLQVHTQRTDSASVACVQIRFVGKMDISTVASTIEFSYTSMGGQELFARALCILS